MKLLAKILAPIFVAFALLPAAAQAQEAPDVLVKRISEEVVNTAKADKQIQGGNQQRVLALVEEKIIPHVDFQHMTALAAGRYWRQATPQQQQQLTKEFRDLLIHTYSGAISQVRDQELVFKPMRAAPADTEVEVRSEVQQARGEPIQLNYRLEKTPAGWKIYDVNVLGAWLVETYKGNFSSEIGKSGIDGLIKVLAERNAKLRANSGKARVASRQAS
ncbi:phospholipid-binding protein MlaC [Lacisediminimonas sp.]|uniref:MlaC/ttg2D family ABC transporter substrate-binding protein n=1 Tax=Lacisediminimonas sp. TaxID=3060582 RepID=UPI002717CD2B|nr:ABC transporter substrate-binding protein [Lacisediminimonas sp.]MDO8301506.1 ABC transporter substrate-binding protein [Lacisediminimonas sp.]